MLYICRMKEEIDGEKVKNIAKTVKQKGFKSQIQVVHDNLKSLDNGKTEKLLYYLWLCEVQNWLREFHNIIVWSQPTIMDTELERGIDITYSYFVFEYAMFIAEKSDLKTYEEALELGIEEALKLIPA